MAVLSLLLLLLALPLDARSPVVVVKRELHSLPSKSLPELQNYVEQARLHYYLGMYSDGVAERKNLHAQGVELAQKARKMNSKDVGAIFWWVANKGELAQLKNNILALGYLKDMEKALLDLKTISADYRFCGADRILGRIYHKAPNFVSIGSPTKAEEHFQIAKKCADKYPGNQIFYADFLLEKGDKKEAQRLARAVLSSPELKKHPIDQYEWIRMAKDILKKSKAGPP